MLGIDTDSDAIANFYTSSPAVAQLNNVVTARIYVLARSAAPDPNYVNDKTYNLGDVTRDFSGSPDNFYRRVFTATVSLRNQRNRINTASGT
jgi:type IV pilus assembly protein PilW